MAEINEIVRANVHHETAINTDEGSWYNELGEHFASHDTVHHKSEEYVRYSNVRSFPDGKPGPIVTTNTVEGYYSIFKRGMKGVYQHCAEKHLHRYLSEFDFRYTNRVRQGIDDVERTARAVQGAVGKRLTYRTTHN
jgi:ISXO2-like transposase domain